MQGFDDEFSDIVDYIYRITVRIWVARAIGLIYSYYDAGCTIHTPYGVTRSVEEVVTSTAGMINAFPDRESHFLNVAWSGDDQQGFYTSHLGFSRMTNRGPTMYGPATGKSVLIRTVADCISLNNKIHTEWLIRDNSALVRQLGLDRHQVARQLAARSTEALPAGSASSSALRQQLHAPGVDHAPETAEQFITQLLHDIWNRRRLDAIPRAYRADAVVNTGGGRIAVGTRNLTSFIISLLASIPDASISVEHTCWSEERDGLIVAARWLLQGTTKAGGLLGEVPGNQPVSMMGISHFRFVGRQIVEEWTLFDELSVLMQAYRSAQPSN
jgi:predicted ester cyclase